MLGAGGRTRLPLKPTRRARLCPTPRGNRHRLPLVSREQEQVKKEAANYSGNGP